MVTFPSAPFTFINRLTSAEKMGASTQGGKTVLTPTQVCGNCCNDERKDYRSSYTLRFSFSWNDLVAGFDQDPFNQYTKEGRDNNDVDYGPEPFLYPRLPQPASAVGKTARWQAERLIAVAASMVGYLYLHHHVPDWNPSWGRDVGQGVDCTNYTSWLYNYALGIKINSATPEQGRFPSEPILDNGDGQFGPDHQPLHRQQYIVQKVATADCSYSDLSSKLQPGDLLFIAGDKSKSQIVADTAQLGKGEGYDAITHVVMWLGDIGVSPKGTPLITDSHGKELIDDNGVTIPSGVQIRPFQNADVPISVNALESKQGWYFDHFVWALRILPTITP